LASKFGFVGFAVSWAAAKVAAAKMMDPTMKSLSVFMVEILRNVENKVIQFQKRPMCIYDNAITS
jgi:hypothetical protein